MPGFHGLQGEIGVPLAQPEKMECEEASREDQVKAKVLRERFRAGLDVDQYLVAE